jgi:hypothetical protein
MASFVAQRMTNLDNGEPRCTTRDNERQRDDGQLRCTTDNLFAQREATRRWPASSLQASGGEASSPEFERAQA